MTKISNLLFNIRIIKINQVIIIWRVPYIEIFIFYGTKWTVRNVHKNKFICKLERSVYLYVKDATPIVHIWFVSIAAGKKLAKKPQIVSVWNLCVLQQNREKKKSCVCCNVIVTTSCPLWNIQCDVDIPGIPLYMEIIQCRHCCQVVVIMQDLHEEKIITHHLCD